MSAHRHGLCALLVLGALGCFALGPWAPPSLERRLYVAHKSRLTVYDIDAGHGRIKKIELPGTRRFKGIGVSVPLERLFLTSNLRDELIAFDLVTEEILWRRQYGAYLDSFAITPDGRTLYLPSRHGGEWVVVDAASGQVLARIETGRGTPYRQDPIKDYGPHNTVISADGRRAYLASMTSPYVLVVDTATHELIGRVGPFSRGVRPLAVAEPYVYVNVDSLLGFEVGDLRTGQRIHRVEAQTPPERRAQIGDAEPHHHTPSHGVAVRPGAGEVWMSDDAHGYLYVYDVRSMPPRHVADVPLFDKPRRRPTPHWITFSLDGRLAYVSCNRVVDAETREVISRIDTSERLVEIHFERGRPVRAGRR